MQLKCRPRNLVSSDGCMNWVSMLINRLSGKLLIGTGKTISLDFKGEKERPL